MALDTYTNLQTAVLQGLARPGDPLVAPALPDMIRLFEIEAKRRLKTGGSETVTLINTVAGQATIVMPADCGEVRAADIMSTGLTDVEPLQYLSPQSSSVGLNVSGRPRFYTLSGSSDKVGAVMRLVPVPDAVYTVAIDYLSDLPPLTEANQSNWLLRSNPDLYYFGALVEAEMYVGHDERVTMWLQRRDLAFAALEKADIKARWAGPLQLRVDAITTGGFGRGTSSSGGGNGNGGTGVAYLDDLLDVDTTGVTPGMVLTYAAPNWVAATPAATGANAPIIADGGFLARSPSARAADAINIKDYSPGNNIADAAGIEGWAAELASGYTHNNSSMPAITARGGYIPGGTWDAGTPITIGSGAFGYSLFGDGQISLLKNVTLESMHVNVRFRDLAIVGNGTGKGLDIRSSNLLALNLDIQNQDVAITSARGSAPGIIAPNNTVAFGSLRDSRIGVTAYNADLRLMFMRSAFLRECGIDFRDNGGSHFLGNNIYCDGGPSIRWTGGSNIFTGNTTIGQFVITNISSFAFYTVDDLIVSTNNLPSATRITAIDQAAGTITVDRAALLTTVGAVLNVTRVPIESFYVNNTFNSGRTDRVEFSIASIRAVNPAVPSAGIRVVTTTQNFKLALGTNRIRFRDTGNTIYNDDAEATTRWVTAIENWNTVVLNVPYAGDVTGVGKLLCNNYDGEIHTGDKSNAMVREHFFVGNNINQTLWQGGTQFNLFGTRLNGRITFDGFRPFRGNVANGSKIVTGIYGINTNEIRNGVLVLTSTASFPTGSFIESVDSPTQITINNPATEDVTGALFTSPHTPNAWFHVGTIDNSTTSDLGVVQPTGPGSTMGWTQISMFPDFNADYQATEGGYWVGARVPYTSGGMKDGQAQYLNEIGPTNTGIHIRSNSVKHFLRGSEWVLDDNRNFEVISIATANSGASILLTLRHTCPLIAGVDRVYLTGTTVVGYDNVEAVVEAKPRADQIQLPIALVTVLATALVNDLRYNIVTVGTTDWTLVGAASNTVGITFIASNVGLGTGSGTASINPTGTLNTDASLIVFREGFLANELGAPSGVGVRIRSSGRPMVMEARAYRNNGGTIYGNSMFRWRAPRLGTLEDDTAPGGAFAVLPGNSADNTVRFFLGATNSAVDLTGDAASIKALSTGKFEIQNNGAFSGYYGSEDPWLSFSRTSSSYLGWTTNAASRLIYSNDDTGNAATANIEVRQSSASLLTAVRMTVYSTGFASVAPAAYADGGAVYSDAGLSAGLTVAALAGNLRLVSSAGNITVTGIPGADPGVPGALYHTAGAVRVSI